MWKRSPQSDEPTNSGLTPRRPRTQRRTTRVLVLLVSVILLGNALVGERGLIALLRSTNDIADISNLIETLRNENNGLREEVRSLREEPRAIEDLARSELGLIEPGEMVFIISEPGQVLANEQ